MSTGRSGRSVFGRSSTYSSLDERSRTPSPAFNLARELHPPPRGSLKRLKPNQMAQDAHTALSKACDCLDVLVASLSPEDLVKTMQAKPLASSLQRARDLLDKVIQRPSPDTRPADHHKGGVRMKCLIHYPDEKKQTPQWHIFTFGQGRLTWTPTNPERAATTQNVHISMINRIEQWSKIKPPYIQPGAFPYSHQIPFHHCATFYISAPSIGQRDIREDIHLQVQAQSRSDRDNLVALIQLAKGIAVESLDVVDTPEASPAMVTRKTRGAPKPSVTSNSLPYLHKKTQLLPSSRSSSPLPRHPETNSDMDHTISIAALSKRGPADSFLSEPELDDDAGTDTLLPVPPSKGASRSPGRSDGSPRHRRAKAGSADLASRKTKLGGDRKIKLDSEFTSLWKEASTPSPLGRKAKPGSSDDTDMSPMASDEEQGLVPRRRHRLSFNAEFGIIEEVPSSQKKSHSAPSSRASSPAVSRRSSRLDLHAASDQFDVRRALSLGPDRELLSQHKPKRGSHKRAETAFAFVSVDKKPKRWTLFNRRSREAIVHPASVSYGHVTDESAILKEGVLSKRSQTSIMGMRIWNKRYFVLRSRTLVYYKDLESVGEDQPVSGFIDLLDVLRVRYHMRKNKGMRMSLELAGSQTLHMTASSASSAEEWVTALSTAIYHLQGRFLDFSADSHKARKPSYSFSSTMINVNRDANDSDTDSCSDDESKEPVPLNGGSEEDQVPRHNYVDLHPVEVLAQTEEETAQNGDEKEQTENGVQVAHKGENGNGSVETVSEQAAFVVDLDAAFKTTKPVDVLQLHVINLISNEESLSGAISAVCKSHILDSSASILRLLLQVAVSAFHPSSTTTGTHVVTVESDNDFFNQSRGRGVTTPINMRRVKNEMARLDSKCSQPGCQAEREVVTLKTQQGHHIPISSHCCTLHKFVTLPNSMPTPRHQSVSPETMHINRMTEFRVDRAGKECESIIAAWQMYGDNPACHALERRLQLWMRSGGFLSFLTDHLSTIRPDSEWSTLALKYGVSLMFALLHKTPELHTCSFYSGLNTPSSPEAPRRKHMGKHAASSPPKRKASLVLGITDDELSREQERALSAVKAEWRAKFPHSKSLTGMTVHAHDLEDDDSCRKKAERKVPASPEEMLEANKICSACRSTETRFAAGVNKLVSRTDSHVVVVNAVTRILFTPIHMLSVLHDENKRALFNNAIIYPQAWRAVFTCLHTAPCSLRLQIISDINALFVSNQANRDSLLSCANWQYWIAKMLSDLPYKALAAGRKGLGKDNSEEKGAEKERDAFSNLTDVNTGPDGDSLPPADTREEERVLAVQRQVFRFCMNLYSLLHFRSFVKHMTFFDEVAIAIRALQFVFQNDRRTIVASSTIIRTLVNLLQKRKSTFPSTLNTRPWYNAVRFAELLHLYLLWSPNLGTNDKRAKTMLRREFGNDQAELGALRHCFCSEALRFGDLGSAGLRFRRVLRFRAIAETSLEPLNESTDPPSASMAENARSKYACLHMSLAQEFYGWLKELRTSQHDLILGVSANLSAAENEIVLSLTRSLALCCDIPMLLKQVDLLLSHLPPTHVNVNALINKFVVCTDSAQRSKLFSSMRGDLDRQVRQGRKFSVDLLSEGIRPYTVTVHYQKLGQKLSTALAVNNSMTVGDVIERVVRLERLERQTMSWHYELRFINKRSGLRPSVSLGTLAVTPRSEFLLVQVKS